MSSKHGSRKDRLERMLAMTQRELEALAELPEEPEAIDGEAPVIRFDIQYSDTERLYSHSAIRSGDYWYITQRSGSTSPMTWDQLMEWANDPQDGRRLVGDIWLVNGYVAL